MPIGLLIQLDDRNREIEQLKSQLKNLELEKSFKGRSQLKPALLIINRNLTVTGEKPSDDSSPLSEDFSLEFQSLPPLEVVPAIPEIDLSCFKQFRMPKLNHKLLNEDDD